MIQTPVIVTFANQKGGVGKTTLCVTFANYLVTKKGCKGCSDRLRLPAFHHEMP